MKKLACRVPPTVKTTWDSRSAGGNRIYIRYESVGVYRSLMVAVLLLCNFFFAIE